MNYAKKYDVYADKIKVGSIIYNGRSDWEFYNLVLDYGGDGLHNMTDALGCLLDQLSYDETFEIRLVPVRASLTSAANDN